MKEKGYHREAPSYHKGQEDALLNARVLRSLTLQGAASVGDMIERIPKVAPAEIYRALNAAVEDGAAWIRFDGEDVYVAERGESVGGFFDRGFVVDAFGKLKAGATVVLSGVFWRAWNIVGDGSASTEEICAGAQLRTAVLGALQSLRAVGLLRYDGAGNWTRDARRAGQVARVRLTAPRVEDPAPPPRRRVDEIPRLYKRGDAVTPPDTWMDARGWTSPASLTRVYRTVENAGCKRTAEIARICDMSNGAVERAAKFLAACEAFYVRRGGLPGDGVDAAGYVFGIGTETLESALRRLDYKRGYVYGRQADVVVEYMRGLDEPQTTREIADAFCIDRRRMREILLGLLNKRVVRCCGFVPTTRGVGRPGKYWALEENCKTGEPAEWTRRI